MRLSCLIMLSFASFAVCQNIPHPLTQVGICKDARVAVVRIDTDSAHGTGFIVSHDGWILTALHVIADQRTLTRYGHITVAMVGHPKTFSGEVISKLDDLARLRDFAILKIEVSDAPALELGNEIDVEDGSPIAVIGFPLSASLPSDFASVPRFCLSGTVAAQTAFPLGNLRFLHTIYFQGVSIKGISGAPIISLVSGKVIGIVSTKLTGIGKSLDALRANTSAGGDVQVFGTNGNQFGVASSITSIINVLDDQLANGLGSGTGVSDAAVALQQAEADYKRSHSR